MPANQPSEGAAPSAEELKERVDTLGQESELGAGEGEPDPATAEQPPQDLAEGSKERKPD